MSTHKIFEEFKLSNKLLRNRIAMAPLTRQRAVPDNTPTPLMAEHYAQRASAGLIIAEATQISRQALGYVNAPGIHNQAQIEGWQKITKKVHEKNGCIYLQIWHTGRVSHSDFQVDNQPMIAPSAIKIPGFVNTPFGKKPTETPRSLELNEIPGIISDYANAASNAMQAGFDGVEIHGANGYLIDQFLNSSSNKRNDIYGGSIDRRSRFLFEVVEAVAKSIGEENTGIRLSPSGLRKGMYDPNPIDLYTYVVDQLNQYDLSYLHILEPLDPVAEHPQYMKEITSYYRDVYNGVLITNGGFTLPKAKHYIDNELADIIAFGKLYISNPDLVERFKKNAALNDWDTSTFYGGDYKGYTDYPFME